MTKNTSTLNGDKVKRGAFSSDSKAIKKKELIKELIKGEKSGFVKDFDKYSFLDKLHSNYSNE
ncbi:MAG TPA: hypothetical protein VK151_10395 [Fluviicola sp.]|nr:hypothetical protein [Fluviicola sp.]